MSSTVSASEANRQFSRILRAVEAGETVIVTSHGRPVARIAPVDEEKERLGARRRLLEWLAEQPVRSVGSWSRAELYER